MSDLRDEAAQIIEHGVMVGESRAAIAEAVAAKVIRDILSMFNTENEASDKCNHRRGARAAIRHYAIEHGMDLGDKE